MVKVVIVVRGVVIEPIEFDGMCVGCVLDVSIVVGQRCRKINFSGSLNGHKTGVKNIYFCA